MRDVEVLSDGESLPAHAARRLAATAESPHAAERLDLTGTGFPHGLRR